MQFTPARSGVPGHGSISRGRIQVLILFATFSLSLGGAPAFAATTADQPEFEAITDTYMEKVLSEYHVAGAAVSVVKDGELLFSKGYGFADLDSSVPVDGDVTAFQIASVTKLFTATAVMRLAEQGTLDLDADVNEYLSEFQIESSFQTPVTLRHLLTHTSGLDDRTPLYVQSNSELLFDDVETLESTMKKYLPPVTREPGSYCQYSVMGMALAGYIAQQVSGVPFDRYVTQEILAPLGMTHSSYGLTEMILPTASRSYRYAKGEWIPGGYTLNSNHPGGAIFSSAGDMARFMLAHLDGKGAVLSSDSLAEMHAHQFPADKRLTGYGLGFFETVRNGYRTIEHGGYLPRFSSKLTLLPEEGIGMFIALNTDSPESGTICNEYVDLFYGHFTDRAAGNESAAPFDMDAGEISGLYTLEGYGLTDPTKIKSQLITFYADCDSSGNLHYNGELKLDFKYVGDGMFYSPESGNYCRVNRQNGEWVISALGSDHTKVNAGERVLFLAFMTFQPLFAGMLLYQAVLLIRRKQTAAGLAAGAVCLVDMVYLAATISMPILTLTGSTGALLTGILPAYPVIGRAFLLAILVLTGFVLRVWRKRTSRIAGRIVYAAFCAAAITSLLFILTMNGLRG